MNVFPEDSAFHEAITTWAGEETQHGQALGMWAELADSSFNYTVALQRYTSGFKVNINVQKSIRGSHAGEMVSRCVVETGTSSYYTALGDAVDEPVLKLLCRHIAADELRHYKLFYDYLNKYMERDGLTRLQRVKIGLGRMQESEDDELSYAYFAANAPANAVFYRPVYTAAYMQRAYRFYRRDHVERVVAMIFKACGFKPHSIWQNMVNRVAWLILQTKIRKAASFAA